MSHVNFPVIYEDGLYGTLKFPNSVKFEVSVAQWR